MVTHIFYFTFTSLQNLKSLSLFIPTSNSVIISLIMKIVFSYVLRIILFLSFFFSSLYCSMIVFSIHVYNGYIFTVVVLFYFCVLGFFFHSKEKINFISLLFCFTTWTLPCPFTAFPISKNIRCSFHFYLSNKLTGIFTY